MAFALPAVLAGRLVFCQMAIAKAPPPAAEVLIRDGLELRRLGRDADALAKFEAAYNGSHSPRAAAQWGLCLQAVSRWSDAEPLLVEAISATGDVWIRKNRDVIKQSLETGKSHLGRLEVIGEPIGATVKVGGKSIGTLPLPSPVVVNEGSVDIEVSSQGYLRTLRTIAVVGASYQNIVINLQKQVQANTELTTLPAQTSPTTLLSSPQGVEEGRAASSTSKWVWIGAGGLALAVGVVVGVLVLSSNSDPPPGQIRNVP